MHDDDIQYDMWRIVDVCRGHYCKPDFDLEIVARQDYATYEINTSYKVPARNPLELLRTHTKYIQ